MSEIPHLNVHIKILPWELLCVLPARFDRQEEYEVKTYTKLLFADSNLEQYGRCERGGWRRTGDMVQLTQLKENEGAEKKRDIFR